MFYVDFFNYIKSFDIFALQETHVCLDKSANFNKYFCGFELFWLPATRESAYGRAIGGSLLGVKKELCKLGISYSYITVEQFTAINVKINSLCFNIIPLYMRSAKWDEDFARINTLFNENDLKNPIVIGDLNVRIGSLQNNVNDIFNTNANIVNEERRSKDKVVNARGRNFINFCCENGMVVTNGMMNGDADGEFTFISGVGSSVNDICAVFQDFFRHIDNFIVDNQIWSDHLPLVLSVKLKIETRSNINPNLLPKLHWKNGYVLQYHMKIREHIEVAKQQKELLDFGDISKVVKEAYTKVNKEGLKFH